MPTPGAVERIRSPSRQAFERDFADADRPVIIEDALSEWPALRSWSPESFREKLGHVELTYKRSGSHVHPDPETMFRGLPNDRTSTLAEYLELITTGEREERARYYLSGDSTLLIHFEQGVHSDLGVLLDDVRVPALFEQARMVGCGVWLSAPGVRSHLHFDDNGAHNLNAQITGSKRVRLYAPTELPRLYPVSFIDSLTTRANHNFSRVDVECPDLERFPAFKHARCVEGVLGPGDLLFIPSFWFHTFEHLGEFNTNVNFWWLPERWSLHQTSIRWVFQGHFIDLLSEGGQLGLDEALQSASPELIDAWRSVERKIVSPFLRPPGT